MRKIWKIAIWSAFGLLLFVVALLCSTIKILRPERLTPVVNTVANRMLNADVNVSNAELSLKSSFPFLNLEIDNLTILSRDIRQLPVAARDTLPAWCDTLIAAKSIKGGINLARAVIGSIYLNDLDINGLKVNLVIVNDTLNNFNVTLPSEQQDSEEKAAAMPDIQIKSFQLTNPGPLRYYDLSTATEAEIRLHTLQLLSNEYTDADLPVYQFDINSNISSPLLSMLAKRDFPIEFDGTIDWNHKRPSLLALRNFKFLISVLSGTFDTELDFTDELAINTLELEINPLSFNQVVEILDSATIIDMSIPTDIDTDASIRLDLSLNKPYRIGSDMLPYAQINVGIPSCYVKWREAEIKTLSMDASISLNGDNLNDAIIDLKRFYAEGPATTLDVHGKASELLEDALFDAYLKGWIDISKFPRPITRMLGGLRARGNVTIDTHILGRPSMFQRDNFHKLKIEGDIDVDKLYYLAPDTLTMMYANSMCLTFGSNNKLSMQHGAVDSLLTAKIEVDTTRILVSDLDIRIRNFSLGIGALNTSNNTDTTAIIPMGGRIEAGSFSLFTLSDTAGVKIKKLNGSASLLRYKGNSKLPQLKLRASLGRISAGDNSTRFMVTNSQLNTSIHKMPEIELPKDRREVKAIADSLSRIMPDIPVDSVYKIALEIRRRRNAGKTHQRRVHTEITSSDSEIIDWGTSSGIKKLLLDWNISGSLSAQRARLFSTSFPLRNIVSNLNIHFNNDSIALDNIEYKAGHSDFLISGNISNMKRAFTSHTPQSLKINFDMLSDTIDVNQIADAFFSGAANKDARLEGNLDDEKQLETNTENKTDSIGPVLIPVNIDARLNINAKHVEYSDIKLQGLHGEVLIYDGALNLHQLKAASAVGSIDISALYSAPTPKDMQFGFGMQLSDFNIRDFLNLVPAVDSIMPLMRDFSGIINAQIAATSNVDEQMNLLLPTLHAAITVSGDSLVFLDNETFRTLAKWLMFKDKNNNMIPHMSVQLIVEDNQLRLYPFMFDFDRYRLGVQGHNDLEMNYNYHVAVLKSPIPFKFGINIKGNMDKFKIRLGRARFNEKEVANNVTLVDTTRVNLINQFEKIFRRGVRNSQFAKVDIKDVPIAADIDLESDTLSAADSLYLKEQGLIPQ